jgi:hypothetical protein
VAEARFMMCADEVDCFLHVKLKWVMWESRLQYG